MRRIGLACRLAVLVAILAVLTPLQLLAVRGGWPLATHLPVRFHRLLLRLLGVRVEVVGSPPPLGVPSLVLANHVSWLDIPVISCLRPVSFIAKSEVSDWPVIGFLSRLQRCIFIERARRAATAEVNAVVAHRLAAGDAIVLFPEGTTGDGIRLLPFRSSLVGAVRATLAEHKLASVRVQPLAIVYRRRLGLPMTRREMPGVAWYGDMELGPHLRDFLRGGTLDVVVGWGEPIVVDETTDRKHTTAAAEAAVRTLIADLRGPPAPLNPPMRPGALPGLGESVSLA